MARIVQMLVSTNMQIAAQALMVADVICLGDESCVEEFIGANGVLALKCLMVSQAHKSLVRSACLILSNIVIGSSEHIQAVLNTDFINTLSNLATKSEDYNVRREAVWAIANGCVKGKQFQKLRIVKEGGLNALISMLSSKEEGLLLVILEAIDILLDLNAGVGAEIGIVSQFEELGGVESLQALQLHESKSVYDKVVKILEKNFVLEEINDPTEERKLS